MLDEKGLLALKTRIDEAKTKSSKLKGSLEYLYKQLKETWSCKSVEEASTEIRSRDKNIKRLETQIVDSTQEVQDALGEDV